MNSVHEQCPNSDLKQCTVTKLGLVHNAHTQNLGRAHTERAVPMSWALLRTASLSRACRAHSQHRSRACWACTGHDTPRQPAPGQVATSWTTKLGHDINPMSRPPFCPTKTTHVATLLEATLCRDIKLMSRPRFCP